MLGKWYLVRDNFARGVLLVKGSLCEGECNMVEGHLAKEFLFGSE